MACNASHELDVFIPVRQPDSNVLGDVIFRGMPTLRCQVGKRALVHFVRLAVRSCSSAAAITAAEGLGNRPSSIFRRHRCAQHCRLSIAMGREPNTLPHAGHCSSLTKSLATALCPWARDLWACLAFSLVKTRTHLRGHSGHNSTPAGTRKIDGLDARCFMPIGLICSTESHCSVTHGCHNERPPTFPINAWGRQGFGTVGTHSVTIQGHRGACGPNQPVLSVPHRSAATAYLNRARANLTLNEWDLKLTSQVDVADPFTTSYLHSRFSGKSAEALHLKCFEPPSLRHRRFRRCSTPHTKN